jgi:2-isopropylmalate synthase/UPF0716 protein FxsA
MKYFLLYLFIEVIVSVNISSYLGGFTTFLEIMMSAFVGISLLVNFKQTLMENFSAVSHGTIGLEEFQKLNLFTLLGAILLIVPGFFTDIVGLLLQFSALTTMIVNRYNVKSKTTFQEQTQQTKDSDVIDVEIISNNSTLK